MTGRKRVVYLIWTIILFIAEVYIERCFHDGFIRNRFGDLLVVILLYTAVRCFIPEGKKFLPLGIFIFAVFVELLQLVDILGFLGLKQYKIARIIAGSQFDFGDIICYAVGCALCYLDVFKKKINKVLAPVLKFMGFNIYTKILSAWLIPSLILLVYFTVTGCIEDIKGYFVISLYIGFLMGIPIALTAMELYELCIGKQLTPEKMKFDCFIIILGIIEEFIYLDFLGNVNFGVSYQEQLYNRELHSPIQHEAYIFLFMGLFLIGRFFFVERSDGKNKIQKMPPLVSVLAIAFLYLGVIFSFLFTYQISTVITMDIDGFLLLLPLNQLIMTAHIVTESVLSYEKDEQRSSKIDSIPVLSKINKLLENAKLWPLFGLIMLVPVLGILLIILILFGQGPNALIKMWTETSDFALSKQVAPQNLYYDEHYLCTVAAGGHRKVVKPKRRGVRHGHEVIVNRQLCVANAFEQILEIHTPKFHKRLRHFYDTYGFPIAKLIKSRYVADLVWFIMKPLEWLFVIVLYLTEVHPEDRIALQYTGKRVEDFID